LHCSAHSEKLDRSAELPS